VTHFLLVLAALLGFGHIAGPSALPKSDLRVLAPLLLEDDDADTTPPLCHNVSPASVLNCANSNSMCVTAITPNWTCKLKVTGGCKCE